MTPSETASKPAVRAGLIAACLPCDSEWIATVEDDTCFICGGAGVPGRAAEYCGHGIRQGRLRCPECSRSATSAVL